MKMLAKRGLVGAVGVICLLLSLSLGVNPARAGIFTPLSLSVTGAVLNAGNQTYSATGGSVVYASIGGNTLDPTASLSFTLSAQVDGFATSGSASFYLAGTSGGQNMTADGQIQITDMVAAAAIPLGCSTTCDSRLPLFFVGASNTTVTTGAGAPSTTAPAFYVESSYFNPWGAPIVLASSDCFNAPFTCSFFIVTTYNTGTIQWQGTETSGAVSGTLSGSPVTGNLTLASRENEDLILGNTSDSGTIALSGMNPSILDVQGTYSGNSTIPSAGTSDCSGDTGFPGTCTQTGFQSTGKVAMQNAQIGVNGTYSTTWGVPALGYGSALSISYDSLDPSTTCGAAVIRANPGQWPTIGLNGSPMISTPNATNTVSFYVTMPDALPATWLAGGCISEDAASFSLLNVTRVAFSVDGGPLQNATFSFAQHDVFECYTDSSMTLMRDWQGCSGSLQVVQVWSGSLTFTVAPTGLHSVTLEAWGQNGVGPFTTSLMVDHSLYSYAGQTFVIAAQSLAGKQLVVKFTGIEPMLTSAGIVMIPVSETYHTIVPQSGVIYGSFLPNSQVMITGPNASDPQGFTLGNSPQSTQQLAVIG